jgi:Right handed beta helix region
VRAFRRLCVFGLVVIGCGVAASPGYAGGGNGGKHAGIAITSNAGFQSCACVLAGSGTAASPYVIGPWSITTPAGGSAITINNSKGAVTDYFSISGISVNYNDSNPTDPVIHLIDINRTTTISNVSANDDGIGIELDGSSNIKLDSISVNKMNGAGIVINGSSNIALSNGKYKATQDGEPPHQEDGLYAVNSSQIQIGGLPACPQSGACNSFDYDSGWGVYLQNTNNVTIDNATANADDTGGFVLDGSNTYNVNLENSTSEAGGPICITVNGLKTPTGYFNSDLIGGLMLVNGTHDNTIRNDTFNGTSTSSGYSIGDGGNPFYFNVCTSQSTPFNPPPDGPMGPNNSFSSVCYTTTDLLSPPTSTCTS